MNTQLRFLLAMALMIGVLVATNMMFPPVPADPALEADSVVATTPDSGAPGSTEAEELDVPSVPGVAGATEEQGPPVGSPEAIDAAEDVDPVAGLTAQATVREVVVEGPLYRYRISTRGALVESLELLSFESFQVEGPAQIVPEAGVRPFGNRVVFGRDTLDLRARDFITDAPEAGIRLVEGGSSEAATFTWTHPTQPSVSFQLTYTFVPDDYLVTVTGRMNGTEGGAVLLTDLGSGIEYNESRAREDVAMFAYVTRDTNERIRSERLAKVDEWEIVEGPFEWVAFKSKFFVAAALAGEDGLQSGRFGGLVVGEHLAEDQGSVTFAQAFSQDGTFGYRTYFGPQERERLMAIGSQLHEVNPYGWRFMRPIIRPFTGVIVWTLNYLHDALGWGYGWVLMVFGVMMRVLLFPLHMKAMRAQLKNMAVQPRLKEIQTKYKDQPEKLQQEMVKLYKEEGFNPLAGCLPMLLPWPVLVALFFVFQNSIQFRGVPFLWLPDLSAPDPLYLLPVFLGLSMFFLQWVSIRSIEEPNPQLKAMMWIMPIFMGFLFMQFASGLNLYYSVANVASLPQQIWVARERKMATAKSKKKRAAESSEEKGSGGKSGKAKSKR